MAKILELYTTNKSWLTPITAGIESTANTKSESSMHTKQRNRGVARVLPSTLIKSEQNKMRRRGD
jgi:hypothetical protein